MSGFFIDQQTIEDLQLFANDGCSVFDCFDKTLTIGGREILHALFRNPLTNIYEINRRIEGIQFFIKNEVNLSFNKNSVDYMEFYLKKAGTPNSFPVVVMR